MAIKSECRKLLLISLEQIISLTLTRKKIYIFGIRIPWILVFCFNKSVDQDNNQFKTQTYGDILDLYGMGEQIYHMHNHLYMLDMHAISQMSCIQILKLKKSRISRNRSCESKQGCVFFLNISRAKDLINSVMNFSTSFTSFTVRFVEP